MSHPCGSYNANTFKVLENLDINLVLRHMEILKKFLKKEKNFSFQVPRIDHPLVIKNDEYMKITLFTGNHNRHNFLVNLLSDLCDD